MVVTFGWLPLPCGGDTDSYIEFFLAVHIEIRSR